MTAYLLPLLVLSVQEPQVKTPMPVPPPKPEVVNAPARVSVESPIDLPKALKLAMENSPLLAAVRAEAQAARARAAAGRSPLGPSLRLGAGYIREERNDGSSVPDPLGVDLTLEQLLLDFGRTEAESKRLRELASAATLDLEAVTNQVRRDVELAFHDALQAEEEKRLREEDVENRTFQLNLAQSRLDDGLGGPGDVVRARASLAGALADLRAAENERSSSRSRLAEILGVGGGLTVELVGPAYSLEPQTEEVAPLVERGLSNRPEVLAAEKRLRSGEYLLGAAKRGLNPSLVASVRLSGDGSRDPLDRRTAAYGVSLSWPIFDSGRVRNQVKEADSLRKAAEADLNSVRLAVTREISEAWLQVGSALDEQELLRVAAVNAAEAARIAQGRYADGLGSFLEVTDAQSALIQARLDLAEAAANLARARAVLAWALGRTAG